MVADDDVQYYQYFHGSNEGSSESGEQKQCVVVDNGCGINGSGDSLTGVKMKNLSDLVVLKGFRS